MGASVERFEFDANASRVVAEYAKIVAESQKLERELKKTAKAAVAGSAEASKSLEQQAKSVVDLRRKQEEARKAAEQVAGKFGQVGQSAGMANQRITQLSFAFDDFMTVAQQQGGWQGIINGARAAGNNLSAVLSAINPLYAIIPSLATALVGLGAKFLLSSDGADKASQSGSRYLSILSKMREELIGVTQGEKAATAAREERAYQEDLATVIQETGFREKERAFQKSKEDVEYLRRESAKEGGVGPMTANLQRALEIHEPIAQEFAAAKGTVQKFVDDRRRLVAARQAKETSDREQAEFGRKNREVMGRADRRYATFAGEVRKTAAQGFAQGLSEQQVIEALSPVMAAGLNEAEQEAIAPKFFEDISTAQQEAALAPRKSPAETAAAGLRSQLADVRARRARAIADAPRNKLTGAQERAFKAEAAPLEAQLAAADAQRAVEQLKVQKDTLTAIQELTAAVKNRNGARPIVRNGGQ